MMSKRVLRHDRVMAQYASDQAAADYAESYGDTRPSSRFFRSRVQAVLDALAETPGGDLLDAGCGPGVMVRTLLSTRRNDFAITALDQSSAMIRYCATSTVTGNVRPVVGTLEDMPFPTSTFDITLAMGVLEYTDAAAALSEISRVTRPKGLVIASMLNPLSVYRVTEWFVYWPLRRALGAIERLAGVPAGRRHGANPTGIHAFSPRQLRRLMEGAGLEPTDLVYFDVTVLVPPFDRSGILARAAERLQRLTMITHWQRRWLATGYLVIARPME
jgi:ubiquinone/menaquinone biosynthesis C-methylase UbiE